MLFSNYLESIYMCYILLKYLNYKLFLNGWLKLPKTLFYINAEDQYSINYQYLGEFLPFACFSH